MISLLWITCENTVLRIFIQRLLHYEETHTKEHYVQQVLCQTWKHDHRNPRNDTSALHEETIQLHNINMVCLILKGHISIKDTPLPMAYCHPFTHCRFDIRLLARPKFLKPIYSFTRYFTGYNSPGKLELYKRRF